MSDVAIAPGGGENVPFDHVTDGVISGIWQIRNGGGIVATTADPQGWGVTWQNVVFVIDVPLTAEPGLYFVDGFFNLGTGGPSPPPLPPNFWTTGWQNSSFNVASNVLRIFIGPAPANCP